MGISLSPMQTISRLIVVIFPAATKNDLWVRTNAGGGSFSSIAFRVIRVSTGRTALLR
jgi:hypothetical protein